ncbi:MAG: hypothetical protein B7W98_03105, partial [Parcubacteria group bacterium 20-58-5]
MLKARNGVRYPASVKERAGLLRTEGMTHREIARELGTGTSTVYVWTKGIHITSAQKQAIDARKNKHRMSKFEKNLA